MMLVEHAHAREGSVPWILGADGQRGPGYDDARRLAEIRAGLLGHSKVFADAGDTGPEDVERVVGALHERHYLRALARARSGEPELLAELAQPGVEPDTPVHEAVVASAYEAVGVAIAAARRVLAGDRYAYALCRPPGHHAGPDWLGGYCYLNNAAAAAHTLREGGIARVGILDLDLHYPNGTSAMVARVARMASVTLYSLHGATGANLPWERVRAQSEREHLIAFRGPPEPDVYLEALAGYTGALAENADAIVLSLGYDLVEGDPHGCWDFGAPEFERIGRLLAEVGLPVCIVQEGGYALDSLADCSRAFAAGLLGGGEFR
jgi:acetoin utilization deacetylase AcuC-like enzyme